MIERAYYVLYLGSDEDFGMARQKYRVSGHDTDP